METPRIDTRTSIFVDPRFGNPLLRHLAETGPEEDALDNEHVSRIHAAIACPDDIFNRLLMGRVDGQPNTIGTTVIRSSILP